MKISISPESVLVFSGTEATLYVRGVARERVSINNNMDSIIEKFKQKYGF